MSSVTGLFLTPGAGSGRDHPTLVALEAALAPLPVARVANVERMQMLVESASRTALQRMLSAWLPELNAVRARHKGLLRWAVDIDPLAI